MKLLQITDNQPVAPWHCEAFRAHPVSSQRSPLDSRLALTVLHPNEFIKVHITSGILLHLRASADQRQKKSWCEHTLAWSGLAWRFYISCKLFMRCSIILCVFRAADMWERMKQGTKQRQKQRTKWAGILTFFPHMLARLEVPWNSHQTWTLKVFSLSQQCLSTIVLLPCWWAERAESSFSSLIADISISYEYTARQLKGDLLFSFLV